MGTQTLYQRISSIITRLDSGLYERDEALRLALLCGLSGSSIFFLGPPGVAKSMVARRVSSAFSKAKFFEYLMGRFSTPDELFGPVSIARLKNEDVYARNTSGFLPEADIVFLDEIWKASPPIQNTLLAALNEKIFRNGNSIDPLPLKLFIGASNEIREDEDTKAFWDRFLVRVQLNPIKNLDNFSMLIDAQGESAGNSPAELEEDAISQTEWERWISEIPGIQLEPDVVKVLHHLREMFAAQSDSYPYVSDRRWKQITGLLRASAYFHGRSRSGIVDSYLLQHCLWNRPHEKEAVDNALEAALLQWSFDSELQIPALRSEVLNFRTALEDAAFESREIIKLVPVRYDGEYLNFIPESHAEKTAESTEAAPQLEYRIWNDDLEELDERGELEYFLYRGNSFLRTELHPSSWSDRENWTLSGGLGVGRIECTQKTVSKDVPRKISAKEKSSLLSEKQRLQKRIENGIAGLETRVSEVRTQAAEHLFVPRSDILSLERAAEHRSAELKQILAEILDLAAAQGLDDAS